MLHLQSVSWIKLREGRIINRFSKDMSEIDKDGLEHWLVLDMLSVEQGFGVAVTAGRDLANDLHFRACPWGDWQLHNGWRHRIVG